MAIASAVVGAAAGVLSVFVVLRKWSYLGEGISHAAYGGVGTAFSNFAGVSNCRHRSCRYFSSHQDLLWRQRLRVAWTSSRRRKWSAAATRPSEFSSPSRLRGELLFSVAFPSSTIHGGSGGWQTVFLFGDLRRLNFPTMLLDIGVSLAVLIVVYALGPQIVAYCFDPLLAETSGVSVGFIHYLLILLVGLVITSAGRCRLKEIFLGASGLLALPAQRSCG